MAYRLSDVQSVRSSRSSRLSGVSSSSTGAEKAGDATAGDVNPNASKEAEGETLALAGDVNTASNPEDQIQGDGPEDPHQGPKEGLGHNRQLLASGNNPRSLENVAQLARGFNQRFLENAGAVKEGESVGPFEMPDTVSSGVGGTWDRGPFGPAPECPSSRKVFQIGVAVDTGFFKVSVHPHNGAHSTDLHKVGETCAC